MPDVEWIEVEIAGGIKIKVDKEFWDRLHHLTWYLNSDGYVVATIYIGNGKQRSIRLSREIIGATVGILVDHKNGDRLDNRSCNLRVATPSQNMMNKKMQCNNLSGFKGVSHKSRNSWQSSIKVDGVDIYLGSFSSPEDAHKAYRDAAIKAFGEFACFR